MARLHAGTASARLEQAIGRLLGVGHLAVAGLAGRVDGTEGGNVAAAGDALQGARHRGLGAFVQAAVERRGQCDGLRYGAVLTRT